MEFRFTISLGSTQIFMKMEDDYVLGGIMRDLFVSSTLLANIAPSIYWLLDNSIDGSTSIYWMAASRWMVATTDICKYKLV